MSYLYKNSFINVYKADIGEIVKIIDSKSKFNNKQMYMSEGTLNGYCYKDYNNFRNNPDEVCYIAECDFDNDLFVDYVKENKEQLINEGGIATANSIKEEIKKELEYNDYFYEYQKDDIVHTITAKNFDNEMIDRFASLVFDIVDWQCTSSYIAETDWAEEIERYYKEKLNESELEI